MSTRSRIEISFLTVAVFISRFVFRSHDLYDIDSVNFGLAIRRFDPRTYQPHPPGYFLYVYIGRLINYLVHDANFALVLLSIAASIGVVIMIYLLALEWFGNSRSADSKEGKQSMPALFSGLMFVFSPLAWFHGTVALTYSVEAFFSALLGYMCWRMKRSGSGYTMVTALVLGLSAGVRPSSLLFLGPLFFYSLLSVSPKRRVLGLAALGITLLAWFIPMILASGGWEAYFGALISLWRLVPSKGTVFNSSPATSIARAATIILIYGLCFGVAAIAPICARLWTLANRKTIFSSLKNNEDKALSRKKIFTAVWITPALCFFIFIFLKFVNSGYLLLVMAPLCIWMGHWVAQWYENSAWHRLSKLVVIEICVMANVLIFLAVPFYCSYSSVRHFENELGDVSAGLPQIGTPDDTLIIGVDNHFLGFRHAGYYLPGYLTLEYPEVKLIEGTRIFAMQNGDTRLLSGLPSHAYTQFVLCPLPLGDITYQRYLDTVKKLLPSGDLRSVKIGGHEYATAPIGDLAKLFPESSKAAKESVTGLFHMTNETVNKRRQETR